MAFAVVFPGQGSQSVGMLGDLAEVAPEIASTFADASKVLGFDLWELVQSGPEAELGKTEITQPAMLCAGVAVWRCWLERGGDTPLVMAGHSLGEYAALVAAEALSFKDAVALVAARGRYMQEAVPAGEGAMAAVMGLEASRLEQICGQVADGEIVACANFNAPGQIVIAGHKAAVERALAAASQAGATRAVSLPVSAPFHCELMRPAAERLFDDLRGVRIARPRIPVVHNVDAQTRSDGEAVKQALTEQAHRPVRWVECVHAILSEGAGTIFEFGPGRVLTGLCRRIDRSVRCMCVHDKASLEQAIDAGDDA